MPARRDAHHSDGYLANIMVEMLRYYARLRWAHVTVTLYVDGVSKIIVSATAHGSRAELLAQPGRYKPAACRSPSSATLHGPVHSRAVERLWLLKTGPA